METLVEVATLKPGPQLFSVQLGLPPASATGGGKSASPDAHASRSPCSGGVRSDASVAGLAHDVRNMVAGLYLYCDLLSQPEVLTPAYQHYADDLRLVAQAGGSLLQRLSNLATPPSPEWLPCPPPATLTINRAFSHPMRESHRNNTPPIENLASELKGCLNLLAAFAGPSIQVEVDTGCYTGPLPLSVEDLTRILINLVRNASEVMPQGGAIRIAATRHAAADGATSDTVVLSVEDDGPGISAADLPHVLESGYTTKRLGKGSASWTAPQLHGLGLAIVRGLVESVAGTVRASSPSGQGARFEISFPHCGQKRQP